MRNLKLILIVLEEDCVIEGDVTRTGQMYYKNSLIVSDNTIEAEGLGRFVWEEVLLKLVKN